LSQNAHKNTHLYRWLTAIIGVPVAVYLIGPGPRWAFCILLCFVALTGLSEFYGITVPRLPRTVRWCNYLLSLILFLVIFKGEAYLVPAVIVLWALISMTFFMLTHRASDHQETTDIAKSVFGPVYVCLPLAMLLIIDRYPNGNLWIFFLLSVICAGDTGAFYIGRRFGKHKLYEAISPQKTWEGAIGGLLSSLVAAIIFLHLVPAVHRLDLNILILVVTLSVTAQIGDLAESMLKRNHGKKDSGRILPGHGGILDRIDGLIFSIPILYMYVPFC